MACAAACAVACAAALLLALPEAEAGEAVSPGPVASREESEGRGVDGVERTEGDGSKNDMQMIYKQLLVITTGRSVAFQRTGWIVARVTTAIFPT